MSKEAKVASSRGSWAAGILVSPVCLGTAPFGSDYDTATSLAFIDTYVARGGNFLDMAHVYGAWRAGCDGASERTVGDWIRNNGGRNRLVLSTKGGHPPMSDFFQSRCTPSALRQDLHESLERLGVDYIDLYFLHRDDGMMPVSEFIETLAEFVKQGLIRGYAASNWSTGRIAAANEYAKRAGHPPFVASQVGWSLATYPAETPPLPGMVYLDADSHAWHAEHGFPLIPFSSQAHGYFGLENVGWAECGFNGTAPLAHEYDSIENRKRLTRATALAIEKDCTANQVALAYLRSQPFPVTPVIGALDTCHIIEAMDAASVSLSDLECEYLDHGSR